MNKKIILIEDDPVLRENTAELLELSDYDVSTAPNGKIGVDMVKKELPDIVICDIMMPELDGYGVLEILSGDHLTKHIPFVFLSAKTEHKDIRKGMDLGADDYLTKPFEEDELISAIESRLAKAAILKEVSPEIGVNDNKNEGRIRNLDELKVFFENEGDFQKFKSGEEIYKEGSNANYLYFVYDGVVKTHKLDENGKDLIIGLHKGDEFFGDTSFAYNSQNLETATVLEDVELFRVSKQKLKEILYDNPQATLDFINYITDNLSNVKEQLLQMAYSSVKRKTASTILKFIEKIEERQHADEIKISRSDLASVAGIATESLIRALSNLKKDGYIDIEGRTIRVLNGAALRHIE